MVAILLLVLAAIAVLTALVLIVPLRFSVGCRFNADQRECNGVLRWLPFSRLAIAYGADGWRLKLAALWYRREMVSARFAGMPHPSEARMEPGPTAVAVGSGAADQGRREGGGRQERASADRADTVEPQTTGGTTAGTTRDEVRGEEPGMIERIRRNRWLRLALNAPLRRKMLGWLGRVVQAIAGCVTIGRLELTATAHLGDYEQTGCAAGYVAAIEYALQIGLRRPVRVRFEPVFDRECFEVRANLDVSSSLIRIIWPLVPALLTFPYLSAWRGWRESKSGMPTR